jgi:hypothetical protein
VCLKVASHVVNLERQLVSEVHAKNLADIRKYETSLYKHKDLFYFYRINLFHLPKEIMKTLVKKNYITHWGIQANSQ